MLAISAKYGYESRNQECTFALMHHLIDEKKISLQPEIIYKISSTKTEEQTSLEIREQYQYGTELSLKEDLYTHLLETANSGSNKDNHRGITTLSS